MAVAEMNVPRDLPDSPVLGSDKAGALFGTFVAVAVAAGVGLAVGFVMDTERTLWSYLWGFVWALSVCLGALAWNMFHHVTDAGWSVVLRRIFENVHRTLWLLAPLSLPVVFGLGVLYKWTHERDHLMNGKATYLSTSFFVIRLAIYFSIWIYYSSKLRSISESQDNNTDREAVKAATRKMQWWAPSGLVGLGLTATFAAFDLIMSLNYHWFSTIFGVIFWADSIRGSMALCVLIVVSLHTAGYLRNTITHEHFHDMGKLMFGFSVFWAYTSFAQYFLYWYTNIPEETKFYNDRRVGSWYTISIMLPICYFAVPFFGLMRRGAKRNPRSIGAIALWVLLFGGLHFYWEIMPESLKLTAEATPVSGASLAWTDPVAALFFAGVIGSVVTWGFKNHPLIPVRDPRLGESLRHEVDEFGDPR